MVALEMRSACRSIGPPVTTEHGELDPQLPDIYRGAEQPPEVEELRLAVRAMVMVHGHFGDAEPRVGDLLHHLEADDAAVLGETDAIEHGAPDEPKVAIDVANRQSEQG